MKRSLRGFEENRENGKRKKEKKNWGLRRGESSFEEEGIREEKKNIEQREERKKRTGFSAGKVLREGLRKQEAKSEKVELESKHILAWEENIRVYLLWFPYLLPFIALFFIHSCGSWTLLDSLVVKLCYYYAFLPICFRFSSEGKLGCGFSCATDHGSHQLLHEMGFHLISLLFVLLDHALYWDILFICIWGFSILSLFPHCWGFSNFMIYFFSINFQKASKIPDLFF